MSGFVAVYDDLLDAGFCQHLIGKFEESPHRNQGVSGRGVDVSRKNSTDVTISHHEE